MKRLKLASIFFIVLLSCSKKSDYKLNDQAKILVDSLSKDSILFDQSLSRYSRLLKVTHNEDLINLTYHKKAIIRCYAFKGLAERDFPEIRELFFNHINDTIEFVAMNPDHLKTSTNVRSFMLLELHPYSKSKYKFTRPEFDPLFKKYYTSPPRSR